MCLEQQLSVAVRSDGERLVGSLFLNGRSGELVVVATLCPLSSAK